MKIHHAARVPSDARWNNDLTFCTNSRVVVACGRRQHWNGRGMLYTSRHDQVTCAACLASSDGPSTETALKEAL